ncbi:hypothetical protein L7F22_031934 [Adiantum nelumboides]|nr:hypothetical protein [Adiantum nelumboides]
MQKEIEKKMYEILESYKADITRKLLHETQADLFTNIKNELQWYVGAEVKVSKGVMHKKVDDAFVNFETWKSKVEESIREKDALIENLKEQLEIFKENLDTNEASLKSSAQPQLEEEVKELKTNVENGLRAWSDVVKQHKENMKWIDVEKKQKPNTTPSAPNIINNTLKEEKRRNARAMNRFGQEGGKLEEGYGAFHGGLLGSNKKRHYTQGASNSIEEDKVLQFETMAVDYIFDLHAIVHGVLTSSTQKLNRLSDLRASLQQKKESLLRLEGSNAVTKKIKKDILLFEQRLNELHRQAPCDIDEIKGVEAKLNASKRMLRQLKDSAEMKNIALEMEIKQEHEILNMYFCYYVEVHEAANRSFQGISNEVQSDKDVYKEHPNKDQQDIDKDQKVEVDDENLLPEDGDKDPIIENPKVDMGGNKVSKEENPKLDTSVSKELLEECLPADEEVHKALFLGDKDPRIGVDVNEHTPSDDDAPLAEMFSIKKKLFQVRVPKTHACKM